MIKLVVSDFDGTLKPFERESLSPSVLTRIDALLERGVAFAVSSGRTYRELASYLPQFVDRIYLICNDGACYLRGDRLLYEKAIERADLIPLFRTGEGVGRIFHAARENYCTGTLPTELQRAFSPIPVKSVYELHERIFKVTSVGEREPFAASHGLRTHWDGGEAVLAQAVNRFANKGTALSDLQMRLMLSKFDTVCIGDAGNDLAMMQGARVSFCVGERSEALADAVTHRVGRVEEALDFCLNFL